MRTSGSVKPDVTKEMDSRIEEGVDGRKRKIEQEVLEEKEELVDLDSKVAESMAELRQSGDVSVSQALDSDYNTMIPQYRELLKQGKLKEAKKLREDFLSKYNIK